MSDMKDCKIVQDLLPSYIEKLTSKDTNEYVEGHLKTCDDCTKIYNDMKADLKANVTSPKAEIDYMKKVRKKMRIAEKLLYIVLLLFIIFVLVFWREIFSFICYTDICNRYLKYQEEVFETGKYTINEYDKSNTRTTYTYTTPEMTLHKSINEDGKVSLSGFIFRQELEGSSILYTGIYNQKTKTTEKSFMTYSPVFANGMDEGMIIVPYYPNFYFNKKATFWDLLSTFFVIRNIRIVDNSYEIDFKGISERIYIDRGAAFRVNENNRRITLQVGTVAEEYISSVDLDNENIVLQDFEAPERNTTEKTTTKLSNCEQEAGTVVAYDFKISNEESSSLKYLKEAFNFDDTSSDDFTTFETIREIKVTNNLTYKKLQERWSGLRDLTDEDFINYTAIIIVDTDKTKELHYKNLEYDDSIGFSDIYMTEVEATSDYQYSASLVIVPNILIYPTNNYYKFDGYGIHIINN